jgi:hypothetical protein
VHDGCLQRPDLPRLKVWTDGRQQSEYGLSGNINYMFPALAANQLYAKGKGE